MSRQVADTNAGTQVAWKKDTCLDQRGDRRWVFLQRVDLKVGRDELVSHWQFELAVEVRTRPFLKHMHSGQREEFLFYPTRLWEIHLKGWIGDGLLFVLRAIPLFCLVGLPFKGLGHHRHSREKFGGRWSRDITQWRLRKCSLHW